MRVARKTFVLTFVLASATAIAEDMWWSPNEARVFPQTLSYPNRAGVSTTLNVAGPTSTQGHPFFTSHTDNGRACVSCHQPADGMSLSIDSIRKRWAETRGTDPIFAANDGSDCPSLPQDQESSHTLMLERGLVRVARPWPPRAADGKAIDPEFTLEVVRDPTRCNLDPQFGLKSAQPTVSVYRRPRPATNIKFLSAVGFPSEPKNGMPLPTDPETGRMVSGNILSDNRVPTIRAQVRDALRTHLGLTQPASPGTVATIESFLEQLYSAQSVHTLGGVLNEGGATGGPEALRDAREGDLQYGGSPIWKEFSSWMQPQMRGTTNAVKSAFRESVARGAEIFAKRTFLIDDSAG
ncbi:MAG TPA: hypothetical protein VNA21_04850, partial [Steroidobacteraceae bacterium]|nr:hypothetical protein [Steroidobacteraceae bacterium]